jgi:hypothetical protein
MTITEVNYCPLCGSLPPGELPQRPSTPTPTHCLKCDHSRLAGELGWVASPAVALGWMCWTCWRRWNGKQPNEHEFGFYNPPPMSGVPEKTQRITRKAKGEAA